MEALHLGEMEVSRNSLGKTQVVLTHTHTSWGGARQEGGVGGGGFELGSSCVRRAKSEVTFFPFGAAALGPSCVSLPPPGAARSGV